MQESIGWKADITIVFSLYVPYASECLVFDLSSHPLYSETTKAQLELSYNLCPYELSLKLCRI